MCMMLATVLEKVGISKGQYVINLNNRKVLNGILEEIGVSNNLEPVSYTHLTLPTTPYV